jgi:starvation-inducible DNA-binding protein
MSDETTSDAVDPYLKSKDLSLAATRDIGTALEGLLADVFALYLKTKNFLWHMSGPHFRDYHLLLLEHGEQLLSMTDPIAERARKLGVSTLKSIGHIALMQRIADNDEDCVPPCAMLAELRDDTRQLACTMRLICDICRAHRDFATAGLLEKLIDEADRRMWFLNQILQ